MHLFRLVSILLLSSQAFWLGAQATLKSPDEFLPHKLGEQFTPHHLLTDYFQYLAANAPATMRLERYGATNEARPLQVAYFSAPENMARLEQIRQNNLRLAGLNPGSGPAPATEPIAIVWLSMSVHGNEASGSECSMLLAYQLARQNEPEVQAWLKNTVVILDPSLNPDGYDRYSHWIRSVSNQVANPRRDAREHREPWPGGRTNHYYFDLNRDWAWATQAETRQRIDLYQRWLPHVHADVHEQYVENPYYFAPAAEPMHDYITPWQRDFQTQIGQNHAKYF
ncbi:MAG: zinc carboxypeptidase, partial [Saprospiraceae bacterium]|nr:zinc carboxypeptidase [Saprospiraceae bacterium]